MRRIQNLLGANLLALWDTRYEFSHSTTEVLSWIDSIQGITLAPAGSGSRALYAADGTNFGGRAIMEVDNSPQRWIENLVLAADLLPSAATPYAFVVKRMYDSSVLSGVWWLGAASGNTQFQMSENSSYMNATIRTADVFQNSFASATGTTGPMLIEQWADGTGLSLAVNGSTSTLYSKATGGTATTDPVRRITLGKAGGNTGNEFISTFGVCLVKPSDTARNNLLLHLGSTWGL